MLQCRDIDALMMDWLYGELDPQNAQSFSSHLEDCSRCHTELAAFERTRELVGELPSEEPPSAVSAILIREAATRATPQKEESKGGILAWLSKLVQPLQHPALAAVATLVLVAGVAGTFYLRDGDDQFVEPELSSEPLAVADKSESPRADLPPAAPPPPASNELADDISGLDQDSEKDEAKTASASPARTETEGRKADLLAGKRQQEARDLLKERKKRRRADQKKAKIVAAKPEPKPNAISGGNQLRSAPKKKADKSFDSGFAGENTNNRPYRAYRDRPDSWVSQQQLRITAAYNRNDCKTAAKIANDILDRSPDLYTKNTSKLEAVKRCKAYVSKEARKRRIARKKRSRTGTKAAGKSKKSPAPAPDADLEQSVK